MFENWWQAAQPYLPLITALGIWAGIVMTAVYEWLRHRSRYDLPVVTAIRKPAYDAYAAVAFDIETGSTHWRIVGVQTRLRRHPCLAFGRQVTDDVTAYRPGGPWQRSLHYSQPVKEGVVMLHPHRPVRRLLFTVALRSKPSVRRRVVGSLL